MNKLYETKILDGWFQIMERLPTEGRNARPWPAVWQEARAQGRTVLTFTFPENQALPINAHGRPGWVYKDHGVVFDADAFEREMYGVYVNECAKGELPVSFMDWLIIFRAAPVVTTLMSEWLGLYKESRGNLDSDYKVPAKKEAAKTAAKRSALRKRPTRVIPGVVPVVKDSSPA